MSDEIAFRRPRDERPEKIERLALRREKGFRYLLGPDLEVLRVPIDDKDPTPIFVIARCEHERREGYTYFIDAEGDVVRVKAT